MGVQDTHTAWGSSESHNISVPTAVWVSWMPVLYGIHQSYMTLVCPLQHGHPRYPFSICLPILYFTLVNFIFNSTYDIFLPINQLLKTLNG